MGAAEEKKIAPTSQVVYRVGFEKLSLSKFAFFEKRRLSFSLPINHGLTVKRCTVIMKSGSSLGGRVWRLHLYSWRKDKRDGVDLNVMKIATFGMRSRMSHCWEAFLTA